MCAHQKLPDEIRTRVIGDNRVDDLKVEELLKQFIKPAFDNNIDELISNKGLCLNLDKYPNKKKNKPTRRKTKFLSYKERKKLGLYSIKRDSLKYNDLLPLNGLWKDYIQTYLNLKELLPKGQGRYDKILEHLSVKMYRADFHGAELTVKRSVCPDYVGIVGMVVMETNNCFLLLGKDNITRKIPKGSCEFQFEVGGYRFTFFGKNFAKRPADRSSKKIKTVFPPLL